VVHPGCNLILRVHTCAQAMVAHRAVEIVAHVLTRQITHSAPAAGNQRRFHM
jgi:hypothetical protein